MIGKQFYLYIMKYLLEETSKVFHNYKWGIITVDANVSLPTSDDPVICLNYRSYDIGIEVDKIVVVRYPGVNRISQMFMNNHGAIDYRLFFDFIQGLYFPSPYSWRDPNSLNPYEDSLGIFDLNRRKIIECLAKNGDYYEKSEVVYVKRMVKREDN